MTCAIERRTTDSEDLKMPQKNDCESSYKMKLICWSLSSGESFKRQRVSSNHMAQSIDKQIGTLPAIKAESHLVQVGLQVLGADFVPRSNDAALEQRKCGFDSIRMNVVPNRTYSLRL